MKQPIIIYFIVGLLSQVKGKVKSKPKIAVLNNMDPQQLMYTGRLYYRGVKLSLFVHSRKKNRQRKQIALIKSLPAEF